MVAKIRVTACLGFISFSEYLVKRGQTDAPVQLTPEESEALSAPASVAELEKKLQSFPSIWDRVVEQISALPPEKQKQGEIFLNNLAQYFRQMEQALSQIKQLQQVPETSSQPWEELVVDEWERQEKTPREPKKEEPKKEPIQSQPPKMVGPNKGPWKEQPIEQPPPAPKKPKPVDPSAFDPSLRTLPTEEQEQKGEQPKPEKSEFAQSPEEAKTERDVINDLNDITRPTKTLEKEIGDILDWVKKVPDMQVSRNPTKFKSDVSGSINQLISELTNIKPAIDNLIDKYAF